MKCGFVSLIGRPNVGKSTLINTIIGKKVAIATDKPQTTRSLIQGIYNDSSSQIVFVDTPGIHKPDNKLGSVLNRQAYYTFDEVDIIALLVDSSVPLGKGDKFVIERLKDVKKPVFLIINKIDKLSKEQIYDKINEYSKLYDFKEIIPLSAMKNNNVNELINTLKAYLPDSDRLFDEDLYTNSSERFMVSEMIREKVFNLTNQEVPHSLTCVVEEMKFNRNAVSIIASIIVDRDSLKKIVVGARGSKIKQIGIDARKDIEELLGKKVYLELYVRTISKWRDKEKYLQEFGYYDFEQ